MWAVLDHMVDNCFAYLHATGQEQSEAAMAIHLFASRAVHIGCNDREQEGTFVWPDGSSCADRRPTFSAWRYTVANPGEDGACVQMHSNDGWSARPCGTEHRGFICERGGEYQEPAMSPGDEYFITRRIFDHGTATLTSF